MGTAGTVLIGLVMFAGLVGTVVPVVPGLAIIWAAALVYGLADGFGALPFGVITVLAVVGSLASFILPHRAGALAGVGKASLRWGIAGGIVGMIVIPIVGLPVGATLGVFVAEQRRLGDTREAWRVTRTVLLGFGLAVLVELTCGVAMIATWVSWVTLAS